MRKIVIASTLLVFTLINGGAQVTERGIVPIFGFEEGCALIRETEWQVISKTLYTPLEQFFGSPAEGTVREYYIGIRKADGIDNCGGGSGPSFRFWFTWKNLPGHQFSLSRDWGRTYEGSIKWAKIPDIASQASVQGITSQKYWRIEAKLPDGCSTKPLNVYSIFIKAVDVENGNQPSVNISSNVPAIDPIYSIGGRAGNIYYKENNVGIGTSDPKAKLSVNGTILTNEVKKVQADISLYPDFVFEKDYNLRPLQEVNTYIQQNGHLPEIPTAKEVEENGISLGEMNAKLLQKIEELTLYVIELNNELDTLKKEIKNK